MNKHKVFLIIGRTATGKSTISKKVANKLGLTVLKSYTDRPKRRGETDENSDHTFISVSEADEMLSHPEQIVASTDSVANGFRYFSTVNQVLNSDFYIIDPIGVEDLKETQEKIKELKDVEFIEIYIRTPYAKQKNHAHKRGTSFHDFESRYSQESKQFSQYEKEQKFKYHVLNDNSFDEACEKLENIIKREFGL